MAKLDQGYARARGGTGGRSGGGGYRRTRRGFLATTTKERVADLYIRKETEGILDILGLDADSDLAMAIRQEVTADAAGDWSKEDLLDKWQAALQEGNQAHRRTLDIEHLRAADVLLEALYAATRVRDRADLDEGDAIDDAARLSVDGGGWSQEARGRLEVRKHVNLAVDNSGSTHMPATGYCSRPMLNVAQDLLQVLFIAGQTHPAVTYDGFSFNRTTQQHTGRPGRDMRERLVRNYFEGIAVDDPLKRDAVKTNLAPLIEKFFQNEERLGLIGQPRLDLILTDGEFESQRDAKLAAEWQHKRGPGVSTYVLNLCPGEFDASVTLPHQFRVVPVHCLSQHGMKTIDENVLRTALNRIAVDEVSRLGS